MNSINRTMLNICSDNLAESSVFNTRLFDFKVDYESDWFIHLIAKDKQFELGIIDRTNDLVPKDFQSKPNGFYMTLVVDDVDAVFKSAKSENHISMSEPKDTFYGQRRLLLKDPNGALVDVSSPIENFNG